MSWKASSIAKELKQGLHGEDLTPLDKLTLMILSENYMEKKGYVWCSQEELAEQCLCTTRGLRGVLERLEGFGLVGIVHRGRKGNYYTLRFIGNGVPLKIDPFEERERRDIGTIEERHVGLEEPARSSRTVDGKTVDGESVPTTCPECGFAKNLCMGHTKGKKKPKSYMRRQFERESHRVEEKPTRSKGEERAERTRKALEVLDHPERLPEHLQRAIQAGRNRRNDRSV